MAAPPISSEATNYARLCLAFRTTCADCLGDILQKNVPLGYGNIYQAVAAKRSQLVQQLKKDQFSMIFPQQSQQPQFVVADCDTSLLYSLIRNVSSVNAPLSGWGKPVSPGDTSLGANVERLRSYRNKIIHSETRMMSSNEFNTIWADVKQCIINIEAVLGGVQHQQSFDNLKTADMDPDFINREITEVGKLLRHIQEKQILQEDCLDEIRKDQIAHGLVLNNLKERKENDMQIANGDLQDVRKAQKVHDDVLSEIKTSQIRQEDSLNDISSVQKDQSLMLSELKGAKELALERIEKKVDKILSAQGIGNTSKRKMIDVPEEAEEEEEGEKQNSQSSALCGIQMTNEGKRQCLEKMSEIKTLAVQEQVQRPDAQIDTLKDSSVTGNNLQPDIIGNTLKRKMIDVPEEAEEEEEGEKQNSQSSALCGIQMTNEGKRQCLEKLPEIKTLGVQEQIQRPDAQINTLKDSSVTGNNLQPVITGENRQEDVVKTLFTLREYQKELAKPAIEGKNVIIVSPTSSGKTIVAAEVIQKHFERKRHREITKVIFLVNQVQLANQQGETLKEKLPAYQTQVISGDVQRSLNISLKDFIDKRDILVVTAQVLLDALVKKDIKSITQFSLLIFDECHHCQAKHPFNQIMSFYMDIKLSNSDYKTSLPQILGLTASVGVGKARVIEQAKEHIKKLMANMDAQEISIVQNNLDELKCYVDVPSEETRYVEERKNDEFGKAITNVMIQIEERMMQCEFLKKLDNADKYKAVLKAPAEKGSAQYTQWVSKLRKETNIQIRDADVRSFINPCRNHLEIYNDILIIYNDASTRDAIDQLKSKMSEWRHHALMKNKNEKELQEMFEKITETDFLERIQDIPNPKLDTLRHTIIESFHGKPDEESRGIIFVKTRELAKFITAWIKNTPDLKYLNPTEFVGTNSSGKNNAMTMAEQVDALKCFRDGRHKMIVATSAGEEGLDISKCNLVIRYDHITNEISMVQSRGRARAKDSKCINLTDKSKGTDEKVECNMIRELMMQKALAQLLKEIAINPEKIKQELKDHQDNEKLNRKLEAHRRKGRHIKTGEFDLRCIACEEYICMSSDVKTVEDVHRVVVLDDLEERVSIIKSKDQQQFSAITISGTLCCKKCNKDIGNVGIYRNAELPFIKISSFLIVDVNDRRDTCKKWSRAPFETLPLTNEDLNCFLDKTEEHNFT
ncbi:hypothetical protein CHS0354_012048 [Potamilus streckersoni]|uniref:RNA helicase n=1 Tax=Potamilus streckersoni TaxID=2493646 RepID=A0AAE0TLB2_9BIVA|nr:hypothetical protein CHS0354_012048 [Potamilus streckersoni]